MITIDEHTFDETLLTSNSRVLDVGCRGFNFANYIVDNFGCDVTAIDADPQIKCNNPKIKYINAVVTNSNQNSMKFFHFGNGTGSYSEECFQQPACCEVFEISTYKIEPFWDLIKLDCEGAEYNILQSMTSPLSRQLSVEFHEHTPARKGEDVIRNIFTHLSQWYNILGDNRQTLHGCESNYWDVLFILREI